MSTVERAALGAGLLNAGWAMVEFGVLVRRDRHLGQQFAVRHAVEPLGSWDVGRSEIADTELVMAAETGATVAWARFEQSCREPGEWVLLFDRAVGRRP